MSDTLTPHLRGDISRRIIPLEVLSPTALQALRRIGHVRKWKDGQVLILRGQPSPAALVVLSGRLRVVSSTPEGDEQLLRWLEPGEVTGLSSVMADSPFPADLVASGATEVLHVERGRLVDLIRSDGETALAIVQVLSLRVIQLLDIIVDQSRGGLNLKVWAVLQRLATFHGKAVPGGTELRVSQSDIAQAVSASRQRVNQQLTKLQEQGRIQLGYRRIVLLKK